MYRCLFALLSVCSDCFTDMQTRQVGTADLAGNKHCRKECVLHVTSTETIRTIRDGEPRTATSTFTQLLSSAFGLVQVQCCVTSTETIRNIMDRKPRTATSTFTQLLSSGVCLFCSSFIIIPAVFPAPRTDGPQVAYQQTRKRDMIWC